MAPTTPATSLPVKPPDLGGTEIRPALMAPTALACLHCQLIGRRRLICARADACKDLPLVFPLGPLLLAAWLATAIAFVVAIWKR
jgi:hypothetical protein